MGTAAAAKTADPLPKLFKRRRRLSRESVESLLMLFVVMTFVFSLENSSFFDMVNRFASRRRDNFKGLHKIQQLPCRFHISEI